MWAARYWAPRYWAARYWAKVGADPVIPEFSAISTIGVFKAAETTGRLRTIITEGVLKSLQTTGRFK